VGTGICRTFLTCVPALYCFLFLLFFFWIRCLMGMHFGIYCGAFCMVGRACSCAYALVSILGVRLSLACGVCSGECASFVWSRHVSWFGTRVPRFGGRARRLVRRCPRSASYFQCPSRAVAPFWCIRGDGVCWFCSVSPVFVHSFPERLFAHASPASLVPHYPCLNPRSRSCFM
jgi:hypothetical protein